MGNIVLTVLDSVRKDDFDQHAPGPQGLADVSYEWTSASSSWSPPSHSSLFTGVLLHQHGVHSHNPEDRSPKNTFFADLVHRSIGVSAIGADSEDFGAIALFDESNSVAGNDELTPDAMSFTDVPNGPREVHRYLSYLQDAHRQGNLSTSILYGLDKLNAFLSGRSVFQLGDLEAKRLSRFSLNIVRQSAEPFFLFNAFIDVHRPMENLRCLDSDLDSAWNSAELDEDILRSHRKGYRSDLDNYRELYAATISYLDDQVAESMETFQKRSDNEASFIGRTRFRPLRFPDCVVARGSVGDKL